MVPLGDGTRVILGFSCNAETAEAYANCPTLGDRDLADAGYDLDLLFTPGSQLSAKLALVAAWLLFTAGLVAAVGWAVASRQDETPDPPARPKTVDGKA